jgi:hypothetical protein
MPTIILTDDTWQSVTLPSDEIWQARGGSILTTVEAVTDDQQGIELGGGMVRTFASGATVSYRALTPEGVVRTVRLVREAR